MSLGTNECRAATHLSGSLSTSWRSTFKRYLVIGVILAVQGAIVGAFYWSERTTLRANQNGVKDSPKVDHWLVQFPSSGIRQPPTVGAEQAGLGEGEEVIGVEAGGKASGLPAPKHCGTGAVTS